jgi:hypothetical protein
METSAVILAFGTYRCVTFTEYFKFPSQCLKRMDEKNSLTFALTVYD